MWTQNYAVVQIWKNMLHRVYVKNISQSLSWKHDFIAYTKFNLNKFLITCFSDVVWIWTIHVVLTGSSYVMKSREDVHADAKKWV